MNAITIYDSERGRMGYWRLYRPDRHDDYINDQSPRNGLKEAVMIRFYPGSPAQERGTYIYATGKKALSLFSNMIGSIIEDQDPDSDPALRITQNTGWGPYKQDIEVLRDAGLFMANASSMS